jgi:hypothetical protein
LQNLWFGGDVARIVGECVCPVGLYFDDSEMNCRQNSVGLSGWSMFGIVIGSLILIGFLGWTGYFIINFFC